MDYFLAIAKAMRTMRLQANRISERPAGLAAIAAVVQAIPRRRTKIVWKPRLTIAPEERKTIMATVEQGIQFGIEGPARALLYNFSDEVARLVLERASERAKTRPSEGPPVVTRDDIVSSARSLSTVLQRAEHWIQENEDNPITSQDVLADLTRMREALDSLCAKATNAK